MFGRRVDRHIHHAETILLALKGTEKRHIYDRLDVRDDLLTQYNQAVLFLKKHINVRTVIKGFEREDIYELPLDALRKALVNALVHRDYRMRGTNVYVEIYDDRVEIVNLAVCPRGWTRKTSRVPRSVGTKSWQIYLPGWAKWNARAWELNR